MTTHNTIKFYLQFTWITSYLLVPEVNLRMSKTFADHIDKLGVKFVDFSTFLMTFTEDIKIEELCKTENLTKTLRQDIFYGLITYDPVRFIEINKSMNQLISSGIRT